MITFFLVGVCGKSFNSRSEGAGRRGVTKKGIIRHTLSFDAGGAGPRRQQGSHGLSQSARARLPVGALMG